MKGRGFCLLHTIHVVRSYLAGVAMAYLAGMSAGDAAFAAGDPHTAIALYTQELADWISVLWLSLCYLKVVAGHCHVLRGQDLMIAKKHRDS